MYKQDTIADILESERAMMLNGARDFGEFFCQCIRIQYPVEQFYQIN